MFKWIKNIILQIKELNDSLNEVNQSNEFNQNEEKCRFESQTKDCNLLQLLKEKQKIKNIIDTDIKNFSQCDISVINSFARFIKILENYGLELGKTQCEVKSDKFFSYCGFKMIENALQFITLEDIDNMANDLKTLKQKNIILNEKRVIQENLLQEIKEIKEKLGIE